MFKLTLDQKIENYKELIENKVAKKENLETEINNLRQKLKKLENQKVNQTIKEEAEPVVESARPRFSQSNFF